MQAFVGGDRATRLPRQFFDDRCENNTAPQSTIGLSLGPLQALRFLHAEMTVHEIGVAPQFGGRALIDDLPVVEDVAALRQQ